MLAVGLLFVGITLISNGYCGLVGVDHRSVALLNLLTGSLSFIINTTYLIVGFVYLFNLDMRIYGIFALFVAINTIPSAWVAYRVEGDWRFAIIWLIWGILWFSGFVEYVLAIKIGKPVFYFAILAGIFTCWIPGYLMLINQW